MSNLTGQLLGKYRLVKHLGTGGFGEVYMGRHVGDTVEYTSARDAPALAQRAK